MSRLPLCFLATAIILSGCASKEFNEPGVISSATQPTERVFRHSYSDVWQAAVGALQDRKYPIASSQRESGLVVTDWVMGKSDRLFSGYGETRIPYRIRFKMTIQLRPSKKGVGVSIKNQEEYYSDAVTAGTDFSGSLYQWIPTKSSTTKEAALLDAIDAKLQTPASTP